MTMATAASPVLQDSSKQKQKQATELVLQKVFGHEFLDYQLEEGTVRGYNDVRVIYLSEDIIRGIYEALLHETGEAWSLILKTSGLTWGRRTTKLLDLQSRELAPDGVARLSVQAYFDLLEKYFQTHGWGLAKFDLAKARSHGLIRVVLLDSLFARALSDLSEPVDHLIGGMVTGMFEAMSNAKLDFAEVSSPLLGSPNTEFVITAPSRIEKVQPFIAERMPADEVIERLCA